MKLAEALSLRAELKNKINALGLRIRESEEIANLFGIEIECDKANGFRYFIRRDRYADTEISEWLPSSLCMASLGDRLKYHRKVMLEKAPENNYIGEVPIHESQTKIHDAADGSYTDYELFVSPTRDFEQELLWHGRKIIVLSPDDFRQEMIGILKDMARSYETGENTVEE